MHTHPGHVLPSTCHIVISTQGDTMKRLITIIASAAVALFGVAHAQQFLTIGTGGVVGVYFPVGGATARYRERGERRPAPHGRVDRRLGLQRPRDPGGQLDLALAQSDVTYQAYNGTGTFEGEAFEGLRTIMGLHAEPMHLICQSSANVESFRDIAGKRVSIGNPGSGIYNTVLAMLDAFDMTEADFSAEYLVAAEQPDFLRDGRIDCFFYTVGIGGGAIRDITATADVDVVPLDDPELQSSSTSSRTTRSPPSRAAPTATSPTTSRCSASRRCSCRAPTSPRRTPTTSSRPSSTTSKASRPRTRPWRTSPPRTSSAASAPRSTRAPSVPSRRPASSRALGPRPGITGP
jgi:TRAP transporter TAXI family solute receptor